MHKLHDACRVCVHVCWYQCNVVQWIQIRFYSYFYFIFFFIIYMHILYMIVFLSKQVEEREMLPALPSPLFSTLNSSCQRFCTKCYKYVHHESEAVWALIVFLSDTSFWCLMQGNGIPEAERKKKEVSFFWCVWYGTLLSILYLLWLPVSLIIMNSWWNLWFKSSLWFHIESKWQFISVQMGKLWRCECDRRAKTLFLHKEQTNIFLQLIFKRK